MKILITGTAGFIGFHLSRQLLERGDEVVGLDSINDYYDTELKYNRLRQTGIEKASIRPGEVTASKQYSNYRFIQMSLDDREGLMDLFKEEGFDRVCHLAAQAGVRYSLTHPHAYVDSNLVGFVNMLEACRHHDVKHLVYASSSSVYGLNEAMPFSTHDNVDHPVSLYAATKKSNELMAHTYSHLYALPTTGLRFFTVYGPWGRPDMALFKFTRSILEERPIQVYNNGQMQRDFTYIDDIAEGVTRVIDHIPAGNPSWSGAEPDPSSSPAPYRIYNIGNNSPVQLMDFIRAIEEETGKEAIKQFMPMQPGDVPQTWADVSDLMSDFGYSPATDIREGVRRFVDWYRAYYLEMKYSSS
jgi:UDP-glucuronate 4-epimerase